MSDRSVVGAFASLIAGIAGVLGSYLATGGASAFIAVPATELLVGYSPAIVVNTVIETLGSLGETLLVLTAGAMTASLLAVVSYASLVAGARAESPHAGAALGGVSSGLLALGLVGSLLSATGVATGVLLVLLAVPTRPGTGSVDGPRRQVLRVGAAVVGVGVIGTLLGRLGGERAPPPPLDLPTGTELAVESRLDEARERSFDLPGAPGLVSEIGEFYTVDINSATPTFDAEGWTLSVEGAVEGTVAIDYEDLLARDAEVVTATLRCIGEPVDGNLLDTAVWTGVPVADLLSGAAPRGEYATIHALDGYDEIVPIEGYLERGLLVYAMNGETLPREHGFPVRLLMPGTWGKVNVKWIDRIEITEEEGEGYWGSRGWNGTAPMRTVAKLWSAEQSGEGMQVGGHAYAGDRGIDAVEVSIDGGTSWEEAKLSETLSEAATWRQWRHSFEADPGEYEVVVRAIDGDGTVQEGEEGDALPDGATGWMSRTISVE
ncbi:molybdopterin-dependent oxidoreductase [Natronorarus salvus]|uniref:molybdopterin-dependent oxidoreductase n=1 Tax=Natronorarus salvus TaxID=3117733 RepID=UPI002F267FCC